MKQILFIVLVVFGTNGFAQQKQTLHFTASFGNEKLQLSKNYFLTVNNDSASFSAFKFYIGKICFYNNSKKVFSLNKYFLVDVSIDSAISISLPKNLNYNRISFLLGVDSLTNSKPSFKESLDPRKGMYWAWHSGYINFKLEGNSPLCTTLNNAFQFHLGGFLRNQLAVREISFVVKKSNNLSINFKVEQFINAINLKSNHLIMTPSWQAVELSKAAAQCFSIINK